MSYSVGLRRWRLEKELFIWNLTVPVGFETDLASVPRFFWRVIAPHELSLEAAIVHDWIYRNPNVPHTRLEADRVLWSLMTQRKVSLWRRLLAYWAVRLFGWIAWRNYIRRRVP